MLLRVTQRLDHAVGERSRVVREALPGLGPRRELIAVRGHENVHRPPRSGRADALQELEHTEPRDLIARVVGQAEERDQVLDVGRLEVAESAVLDERDLPAGELELE